MFYLQAKAAVTDVTVAATDITTALTAFATCTISLVCDDLWSGRCYRCEVEPGPAAFLLATRMHTQHIACLFSLFRLCCGRFRLTPVCLRSKGCIWPDEHQRRRLEEEPAGEEACCRDHGHAQRLCSVVCIVCV